MNPHPVRLSVTDDLARSRLTVFFRIILIIPHAIWVALWGIAVVLVYVVNWFATLILGRSPVSLHRFTAAFVRYVSHVYAYFFILADEYPGFTGGPGFAVDIQIDPPAPQSRWKTLLRPLLALPALMLTTALSGSPGSGTGQSNFNTGLLQMVGFLGWFSALARARMPRGMRDAGAYSVGYSAQAWSYVLLLTDRYPNSDPVAMGSREPLPDHPIRMTTKDDLRRSRLTVLFRFLLSIPHFIWVFLWGIAALFAVVVNWVVTLVVGQSPASLHRFLAAYVRYVVHVYAYLMLVANPFPGFAGEPFDIDVVIAPPQRQNRWITAFRFVLAIPALFIAGVLLNALFLVAIFGWFASLVKGAMPLGLRNLGAFVLRYSAQVNAYVSVLTDAYPFSGPPAVSTASEAAEDVSSSEESPALET